MTCAPSEEIIAQVRAETGPRTILSFSRGKDAIAAYIAIRPHFEEIIPYHLYLVPGLEFVDESLAYYEKKLQTKIWNLPHPSLYNKFFGNFIYQSPATGAVIDAAKLPKFDYLTIRSLICEQAGLDEETALVASGVRAADSGIRHVAFMKYGAISRNQKQYYPVWDWNKERLLREIEASGIGLPIDYELFGRSFDGIDYRFLAPLKMHRPRDYARVLEFFPLADLELWRYERFAA